MKGCTASKDTIQFPYDKPLPLDLIADIAKLRVRQDAMST